MRLATDSRSGRVDETDPVGPLWRAAQIFRLLTFLYALGFQIAVNDDLTHPAVGWSLFAVLTVANITWAVGYLEGFGRRWWFVALEVVVFAGMMLSTRWVASDAWIQANQSWPTTLWASNSVLSAALLGGAVAGGAVGALIGLTSWTVKERLILNFGQNATLLLLIVAGIAVGLGASRARFTQARLRAAIAAAAQAGERERLAREVHDGVLQTLALISRRGREIGGPTTELADLAAGQERRLRALIADGPVAAVDGDDTDLAAALRGLAGDRVSVSAPADPVTVPTPVGTEILAAVANILDNTARHAGDGARSFVLLEDLDDEVVLSVRDDGAGIPSGRLPEAAAEGRLGIARSIIGRIESLGGTAKLESAPGAGTEWELTVPLSAPAP
ncbi:MAG: DUF5931 domain-containing protein [Gordonia sp. (in: high G+C Gram-positive bacteria)]|uniref:MacS family sensor histidine kinase n=1 Tax=Gordonia sp. (in: high G+C Gram-positive bacteria) TaxID=84139 RepID=UPI0039E25929